MYRLFASFSGNYYFGPSYDEIVDRCNRYRASYVLQPWRWQTFRPARKLFQSFTRRQLMPGLSQLRRAAGRVYGGFKTKARQLSKLTRK